MSGEQGTKQQYLSDQKLDEALDAMLRRTAYGLVGGAAVALLILRAPTARASALGAGAGFGLGSACSQYQEVFHEILGVKKTK